MTAVVGIAAEKLIDLERFEALHERLGAAVFDPALKEVLRQLWKLTGDQQGEETCRTMRQRLKQIEVIAERFCFIGLHGRARAMRREMMGLARDAAPPAEMQARIAKLTDRLWETQALIESGSLIRKQSCIAA
jgi:hypothetical protein